MRGCPSSCGRHTTNHCDRMSKPTKSPPWATESWTLWCGSQLPTPNGAATDSVPTRRPDSCTPGSWGGGAREKGVVNATPGPPSPLRTAAHRQAAGRHVVHAEVIAAHADQLGTGQSAGEAARTHHRLMPLLRASLRAVIAIVAIVADRAVHVHRLPQETAPRGGKTG